MLKKLILALSVLGFAASAGAVLAADGPNQAAIHRHHVVRQAEPQQFTQNLPLSWNLPEGWPHTP